MKPVAAGCEWLQGGWKNQDALLIQRYSSKACDYASINPYAFERPVSPHIACGDVDVDLNVILNAFHRLQGKNDYVVVEGAGGWLSPLSRNLNNAQLAEALDLPVILVVGIRLGCINHARLTYQAIAQAGQTVFGWLAVCLERDMPECDANLTYLNNCIPAPFLGMLPYISAPDFDFLSGCINI